MNLTTYTFKGKGAPILIVAEEALGAGGGLVLTRQEAERLLRQHGEALPFDVMARNYGEEDGNWTGLTPEDLDTSEPEGQQLDPDWGPFEAWVFNAPLNVASPKPAAAPAPEVCPGCGAILCVACACKARRRFHASSEPLFERVGCCACTHGTHPATSR